MPRTGWGIKPLTQTHIPRGLAVLTVRPRLSGDARRGYAETWRCAALAHSGDWPQEVRTAAYGDDTPERLWRDVSGIAKRRKLTSLWSYDLTTMLRLSQGLYWLPALGWELVAFSLNPGAAWMTWRNAEHTLKFSDAMSLWTGGLDDVARMFGMGRKPVPPDEENPLTWLSAVAADRDILTAAMLAYTGWLKAERLGNLAVTGNGQAWSAFRRRFLTHGILVHDDDDLHAMERRAMWTGRCEAYWHGTLGAVTVTEWDFSKAHTRLCAELAIPTFPYDDVHPGADLARVLADQRYAVLAEVEVTTTAPVVPTVVAEHMAWPVGTFTTTLWSPELAELLAAGASVRVIRGARYKVAPVLQEWGRWILAHLDTDEDAIPAWQREVLRKWGNVLVGRFAMRYPLWREIARPTQPDAFCMPYLHADTGVESMLMQVGTTMWLQDGYAYPHDTAPAVTGYIMSAMRAKLWRVIRALPEHVLLYVDTDSLLVTSRHDALLAELAASDAGAGLRRKRSWNGMAIYGPRQIVTGELARVSGVPRGAKRTGRHEWTGEVKESLTSALAARDAGTVRSQRRTWQLTGVDVRRQTHGVGWTSPFLMGGDATA